MTYKKKLAGLLAHTINFGDESLTCYFDQEIHPYVLYGGKRYDTIGALVDALPFLTKPKYHFTLCQMINFLSKGIEYSLIEDAQEFQRNYHRRVEQESKSTKGVLIPTTEYGIFDTLEVHPPEVLENEITFYVRHDYTGIPYRVTCSFPPKEGIQVRYELLPLIT